MTTDLLWGISIGCVILIGMVKLWQMSQAFVTEMDELRELARLHRTVGMAVGNATIALIEKKIDDSLHHFEVAQGRVRHVYPTSKKAQEVLQAIRTVITDMEVLIRALAEARITHRSAVTQFRLLLNRYTAIGIQLEGYRGES